MIKSEYLKYTTSICSSAQHRLSKTPHQRCLSSATLCPVVSTQLWWGFFPFFFCDLHKHKKRFILSLLQNIWVSSLAAKHWICWACYLGCLRNVASQVFLILCVTCLKLFSSGFLFATYCNIVSVCMVVQGIHHQWTHVLDLFLK